MALHGYALGCPIWGLKGWVGELFTRDARPADFLRQYSSVFNTVEGNTTFYGVPAPATVARWRDETPPDFRFCFKFPRTISHERRLVGAEAETAHFFDTLAPLGSRLGPFFLQLPPTFAPSNLDTLASYLTALPAGFHYAVEVRHPDFFAAGEAEGALDTLLAAQGVDRVLFDTRGLRAADGNDPETREAQRRKPDLPVRFVATGPHPFVRFVAHPEVAANEPWLAEWADVVAAWLREGRHPFIFMHSPDDFFAPRLARRFHALLAARHPAVGTLPPWPATTDDDPPLTQLALF